MFKALCETLRFRETDDDAADAMARKTLRKKLTVLTSEQLDLLSTDEACLRLAMPSSGMDDDDVT
jgi:hypothetical protein